MKFSDVTAIITAMIVLITPNYQAGNWTLWLLLGAYSAGAYMVPISLSERRGHKIAAWMFGLPLACSIPAAGTLSLKYGPEAELLPLGIQLTAAFVMCNIGVVTLRILPLIVTDPTVRQNPATSAALFVSLTCTALPFVLLLQGHH